MKRNFPFLCSRHSRNAKRHSFIKRLVPALCLILFVVANAKAQTPPDNKAFYLIGTMNGWTTITENEAADFEYKLTDVDGDGIYTGSFYIPEGELEFKVFSEPGSWSEAPYFGYGSYIYGLNQSFYVFNEDSKNGVITLSPGESSNNVKIANWKGGLMTMSIKWIQDYEGDYIPQICTIKGANQPDMPSTSNTYIIGDFNNWQLPDATSDNGSFKINYLTFDLVGQINQIKQNFNKGDTRIAICKYDDSKGEYAYFKSNSSYDTPFSLYKFTPGSYVYSESGEWISSSNPQSESINIMDWQGGEIAIELYDLYEGNVISYFWNNSDIITEFPKDIYTLVEYNGTKEIFPVEDVADYTYYVWGRCYGQDVSVIFTSENSLNPKPENCWGLEKSLAEYGMDNTNRSGRFYLVKGGEPFTYSFDEMGELFVSVNFTFSQADVSLIFYDDSNKIYVVGDIENNGVANKWLEPSQANADFYNKYFSLTETSRGVFEGTYFIPALDSVLPNFRFYTALTGWDGGDSYGSGWYDFTNMEVDLENGGKVLDCFYGGKGNWSPMLGSSWQSNYVKMTVDTNWQTLTLEVVKDNPSGLPVLENDSNASECWYNLQGIKVERPRSGTYIHVKDGKSTVRILK